MTRLQIWVELPDEMYLAYEREARRRDVPVETLVEQTVKVLLEEMEQEDEEGTDHQIVPS